MSKTEKYILCKNVASTFRSNFAPPKKHAVPVPSCPAPWLGMLALWSSCACKYSRRVYCGRPCARVLLWDGRWCFHRLYFPDYWAISVRTLHGLPESQPLFRRVCPSEQEHEQHETVKILFGPTIFSYLFVCGTIGVEQSSRQKGRGT